MTDFPKLGRAKRTLLSGASELLGRYVGVADGKVDRPTVTLALGVIKGLDAVLAADRANGPAVEQLRTIVRANTGAKAQAPHPILSVAAFASSMIGRAQIEGDEVDILRNIAERLLRPIDPETKYPEHLRDALRRKLISMESTALADVAGALAFPFYIDPGDATADDIRNVLVALSDMHKAAGGAGLRFTVDRDRILIAELA